MREVIQFLAATELQHLDLGSCRVMAMVHEGALARLSRQDDLLLALQEGVPPLHNNTLAFLNLDNFEVGLQRRDGEVREGGGRVGTRGGEGRC